jgi:hypothetical protein
MAVGGLDVFREHFKGYENSFLLIGGAACDAWFGAAGLGFRRTVDLDIVLILEALSDNFVTAFHEFIRLGGYRIRNRSEGGAPVLYRFGRPQNAAYPRELELFSRTDASLELVGDQQIVPVRREEAESLSAILLDENYYNLILEHRRLTNGIWMADATALIPLKARAWIDLSGRQERGESVDTAKITKHRNDIFGLATTLRDEPGLHLPEEIQTDLVAFLDRFPDDHLEWPAVLDSICQTIGGRFTPQELQEALRHHFSV